MASGYGLGTKITWLGSGNDWWRLVLPPGSKSRVFAHHLRPRPPPLSASFLHFVQRVLLRHLHKSSETDADSFTTQVHHGHVRLALPPREQYGVRMSTAWAFHDSLKDAK